MGYDAARLRVSDAKVTPRLQLIKAYVECRKLIRAKYKKSHGELSVAVGGRFPRDSLCKGQQRLSSVVAIPILYPSRHEEKEIIVL